MMFSSKTPRDLNHDKEPIIMRDENSGTEGRIARWEAELLKDGNPIWGFEDAPRPEFDHVQHNAPNPLLIHARLEGIQAALWNLAYAEMEGSWVGDLRVTKEHYHHANRVLPRLANLVKED